MTTKHPDWPVLPLSRLVGDVVDGPFGSNLTSAHYSDDGARVVRLGNIGEGDWKGQDSAFIPMAHFNTLRRHEVHPGDLLIAGLGDESHHLGRACPAPDGLGPALVKADCFRARPDTTRAEPRFLMHFLNSSLGQYRVQQRSEGSTRSRATPGRLLAVKLSVPPLAEQRRIADFLDAQTARIDQLIAQRDQQIRVLADEVEPAMLASHLEDPAGKRPRIQLKHLASLITSGPRGWGELMAPSGTPFIRILNLQRRGIDLDLGDLATVNAPPGPERERSKTQDGDVLVSITADLGSVGVVREEARNGNVSQHIALIRPTQGRTLPDWLAWAIKSPAARGDLLSSGYGGTKVGLGLGDVAGLMLSEPPLDEQAALAREISTCFRAHERLRSGLERQSSLLRERRQALITAAVTGELDVTTARSAA